MEWGGVGVVVVGGRGMECSGGEGRGVEGGGVEWSVVWWGGVE